MDGDWVADSAIRDGTTAHNVLVYSLDSALLGTEHAGTKGLDLHHSLTNDLPWLNWADREY